MLISLLLLRLHGNAYFCWKSAVLHLCEAPELRIEKSTTLKVLLRRHLLYSCATTDAHWDTNTVLTLA